MKLFKINVFSLLIILLSLLGCSNNNSNIPSVGFVDAFEDETIKQAYQGFIDALAKKGFSEKDHTLKVYYRNAQGDIPTLNQIIQYFDYQKVDLIATSPSLATIAAVQQNNRIPIFMMVSPMPEILQLQTAQTSTPKNLFGVGENLDYIDTSFLLIKSILNIPSPKVGMIYNQSEPQSVEALQRIKKLAQQQGIKLEALPVNNTADVALITTRLLDLKIDAFFANPDNTIFASFEHILKQCNEFHVPIFTSEAGLVKRGAVAAFGADIYLWGYQAGEQASRYLESKDTSDINVEVVSSRRRVFNPEQAAYFNLKFPENYISVNTP